MRESPLFEVRLRRFDVWRSAVAAVALTAVAAVSAWAATTASSRAGEGGEGLGAVVAVATVLALATIASALSLARSPTGVLACRDGLWSFAPDSGAHVAGRLTVALDWGAFLLLRIDARRRRRLWLPVQRPGLEREWHALRCALYSPPRPVDPSAPIAVAPPQ